jgi:predicted nuclease of restriction endonuclease-like (RecB) superfamily
MKIVVKKYNQWLGELKNNIHHSRLQTSLKVNSDMLILYWYVGKQIVEKIDAEGWGTKVIEQLSVDLQKAFPDMTGFSLRNLKYMRQFATTYPDLLIGQQPAAQLQLEQKNSKLIVQQPAAQMKKNNKKAIGQQPAAQLKKNEKSIITQQAAAQLKNHSEIGQQVVAQFSNKIYFLSNPLLVSIPWGHHMLLLDKIKEEEESFWYINKTIENNWSRAVLQYQIETDLYLRQHKTKKASNFHLTLPKPQADLANQILKDPYIFKLMQVGENINEKELEDHLVKHIQEFVMELGAGFAFVGRQVKLKAGRKDYFIDLLFYHLFLRCYVVIELKMDEFELSHTGQLNGYLNMVNKQLRQQHDNPSIGIILCGSKDNVEVDYALTSINHPIGVSEYHFSKLLPKNLKDKLPSAKLLQAEVTRFLKKNKILKTKK